MGETIESADKGMKVFDTPDNSTFREFSPLRTRSFLNDIVVLKPLGIVQSTN